MFIHPQIDPIAISIGPLKVHWYGLMYFFGFLSFIYLGKKQIIKNVTLPNVMQKENTGLQNQELC